jgi:hypothetical protein
MIKKKKERKKEGKKNTIENTDKSSKSPYNDNALGQKNAIELCTMNYDNIPYGNFLVQKNYPKLPYGMGSIFVPRHVFANPPECHILLAKM